MNLNTRRYYNLNYFGWYLIADNRGHSAQGNEDIETMVDLRVLQLSNTRLIDMYVWIDAVPYSTDLSPFIDRPNILTVVHVDHLNVGHEIRSGESITHLNVYWLSKRKFTLRPTEVHVTVHTNRVKVSINIFMKNYQLQNYSNSRVHVVVQINVQFH